MVAIGDVVTFVDQHGTHHNALVQNVWGDLSKEARDARQAQWFAERPGQFTDEAIAAQRELPFVEPSINCVIVVKDETKTDSYGRQIEHRTSVPARSAQPAPGMYWFKQD